MKSLLILISVILMWDDPNNPVGTVDGYNVYRVEHDGTGRMTRTKINPTLIPWEPDTATTPDFILRNVNPGEQYRGTAASIARDGYPAGESEISDDFWQCPFPPARVPSFRP